MSYNIEGDLEFYNMLYSELNKEEVVKQESKRCLISKQPLDDTRIKLMCGHEFNYKPLYREIKKQKMHHNHLSIIRLKKNQLQCPYCRNIQDKVLPFKPYEGVTKCYGVNSPQSYEMLMDKCTYVFKSGKRKNQPCNKQCNGKYCNGHFKIMEKKKAKEKEEMKENTIIETSNSINTHILENPYHKITIAMLKPVAKSYNIKGYYKMKKAVLYDEVIKKINLDKNK
mgnify:CR=1 FL=1|tara:strand:- start:10330 stop:11007 length:678 start_codon:yes stop_codon:yes gene_type:complete